MPVEWLLTSDPQDLQDIRLPAPQDHHTHMLQLSLRDPYPRLFLTPWGLSPAHPAHNDVRSKKPHFPLAIQADEAKLWEASLLQVSWQNFS